jgi:hypothetical protein
VGIPTAGLLDSFNRDTQLNDIEMWPELKIINPINYCGWDELLLSSDGYSFFHCSGWARVLHESYHYKPLYFAVSDGNRLKLSIPVMEVKSWLTGKRGVSLPFSDYSDPIVGEDVAFREVFKGLIEYGKKKGWRFIELRGGNCYFEPLPYSAYYYIHTLDLSLEEEDILSRFRSSTRRNIEQAKKRGVTVRISTSADDMREFYQLNCMTRKKHSLPPQPYKFFKNIYKHIISQKNGFIALAKFRKKSIAGAIIFHIGQKAYFKYGACNRTYQRLRANNMVMWEAIRWCISSGYKSFCFGRTENSNAGLRQFKSGWGARESSIYYLRYDLQRDCFIRQKEIGTSHLTKVFQVMPIPILRVAGSMLYRHMG